MEDREKYYPEGIKWTKQRKEVYAVLRDATEPLSAAEIYALAVGDGKSRYAMSTIYRILAAFDEHGFVEKSSFMGDDTLLYEWKENTHKHYAICLNCHKKVPVKICPFESRILHGRGGSDPFKKLAQSDEFVVTAHKLELYGYCRDCENLKKFEKNYCQSGNYIL